MSTTVETIDRLVLSFLEPLPDLSGSCLLVGFSGGPDSVCLAAHLGRLAPSLNIRIHLAYLDHALRPPEEREEENALVKDLAERLGMSLHARRLEPGFLERLALKGGRSLEETAREERYRFLQEVRRETGCRYLALGHHRDDQMETVIMRFFQGAGVPGLAGIRPRRGEILRPFSGLEKSVILDSLKEQGLPYIQDSTNRSDDYLRNRIRNRLIPEIHRSFPGYRPALERFARNMGDLQDYLRREAEEKLPWQPRGREWTIPAEPFLSAPALLQEESLFRLFNRTCPEQSRIPYRFIRTLNRTPGDSPRQILLRGRGVLLEKRGDLLFWSRDIVFPRENRYLITINRAMEFPISDLRFSVEERFRVSQEKGVVTVPKNLTDPPLIFRSREPGDVIELPGGRKTLKKLYNSWQIREEDRWKIPVLEDRSGVLAVLGSVLGGKTCFRKHPAERTPSVSDGCFVITWSEGSV